MVSKSNTTKHSILNTVDCSSLDGKGVTVRIMWEKIAQEMGFCIPEEDMEVISMVLGRLHAELQPVFDCDLSTIEPVGSFRPDGK